MADEPDPGKRRRKPSTTPVSTDPHERLHDMTRGRISALEKDKRELKTEIERDKRELQAEIAQLRPFVAENARLREALSNAETNGVVATSLIAVGGFLVSYATFIGLAASAWANVAAGCLVSGVVLMLHQTFRHWRRG